MGIMDHVDKDKALGEGELIKRLPIDQINPDPENIRGEPKSKEEEEEILNLGASIKSEGLLEPILVSPDGKGKYIIIAGFRRYQAAKMIGLNELPCRIKEVDEGTRRRWQLIENLQRKDLNPIEEAKGIKVYMESEKMSIRETARQLSLPHTRIENALRICRLPEEIQKQISSFSRELISEITNAPIELMKEIIEKVAGGEITSRDQIRAIKKEVSCTQDSKEKKEVSCTQDSKKDKPSNEIKKLQMELEEARKELAQLKGKVAGWERGYPCDESLANFKRTIAKQKERREDIIRVIKTLPWKEIIKAIPAATLKAWLKKD